MNNQQLNWHAPKIVRLIDAPEKNCLIPTEIETGPFGFNGSIHQGNTLNGVVNDWCDGQIPAYYQVSSMYLTFGARENNVSADGPS